MYDNAILQRMNDTTNHIESKSLSETIRREFGVPIELDKVIADNISVSRLACATVFLTKKKHLYVYVSGNSKLLLSDIKKIASRMGFKVESFFPPIHNPEYFDTIGREKFLQVFPGRENISTEDLIFYRTLAPYNPALIQVREVSDGTIYRYDSDTSGQWRSHVKFAYRRIKTS